MQLFPVEAIKVDMAKIKEINEVIKKIYRLIIYSRHHLDDDLLDAFFTSVHDLQEVLALKNAQMEAQDEREAEEYLKNLKLALEFVVEEINAGVNFGQEVQLFQLLRLISPETNALHPNRFRQTFVQIGPHVCPDPKEVPGLVSELFYRMNTLTTPILKAIYFHHELIRVHPFADGNGRVTRIAKNWMLMYELYPPMFINDANQKREYIDTLSQSFSSLQKSENEWNEYTAAFFDQELDRLLSSALYLYEKVNETGLRRLSDEP